MSRYYVNSNAQANGDHEVHEQGCSFMPNIENRRYVGEFATCAGAVAESKRNHFPQSNGCYYCSTKCHTS